MRSIFILNKNKKMRAGQNSREIERDTEYPRAGLLFLFIFLFTSVSCPEVAERQYCIHTHTHTHTQHCMVLVDSYK